jgi:hypothetical protein
MKASASTPNASSRPIDLDHGVGVHDERSEDDRATAVRVREVEIP